MRRGTKCIEDNPIVTLNQWKNLRRWSKSGAKQKRHNTAINLGKARSDYVAKIESSSINVQILDEVNLSWLLDWNNNLLYALTQIHRRKLELYERQRKIFFDITQQYQVILKYWKAIASAIYWRKEQHMSKNLNTRIKELWKSTKFEFVSGWAKE